MALTNQQKSIIIKQASGLDAKSRRVIKYYELQWFMRRHVPSVSEVSSKTAVTQIEINYYLSRRAVQKALDNRGIPWREHSQLDLTTEQVATAITVMNFADQRTIKQKLDQLGIDEQQYYGWLNNPQFKNLVDNLADQNLSNIRPTAVAEFTKLVNAGDWQAVKFYLEATGEFQSTSTKTVETVLKLVVEVIQKHVRDPQVLEAIAKDLLELNPSRTLELEPRTNFLTELGN
jgi:thymidine kinase